MTVASLPAAVMQLLLFAIVSAVEPSARAYDGPSAIEQVEAPSTARAEIVPPIVSAPPATDVAELQKQRRRAGGFIAGGVIAFAVSTTLHVLLEFADWTPPCDDTAQCAGEPVGFLGIHLGTMFVIDPAGVGLIAVVAEELGQRDGARMIAGEKRARGRLRYVLSGGMLAAAGLGGWVTAYVFAVGPGSGSEAETIVRVAGRQLGLAGMVVGAGLVAYGTGLPELRVRSRRTHSIAAIRFAPDVSPASAGMRVRIDF